MQVHVFVTAALMLLANQPAVRSEGRPAGTATSRFENELAGVKLGSKSGEIERAFPTLYRHRLAMGEVLYEACNQKELIVFNFTADPWSPGFITYISVRRESAWARRARERERRDEPHDREPDAPRFAIASDPIR